VLIPAQPDSYLARAATALARALGFRDNVICRPSGAARAAAVASPGFGFCCVKRRRTDTLGKPAFLASSDFVKPWRMRSFSMPCITASTAATSARDLRNSSAYSGSFIHSACFCSNKLVLLMDSVYPKRYGVQTFRGLV